MGEVIYINKKVNKDLRNIEIEMNKMLNKMNNLFNKQFKAMEDQILEIEDKIDEIEQKLWPDYFYIEAVNNNTIVTVTGLGTGELRYSKTPDDTTSWTTQNITSGSGFTINLNAGERYYFVGNITTSGTGSVRFASVNSIKSGGNVYYVANKNGKLSQVHQCYQMFHNCYGLLTPPELPATTLTSNCYVQMFDGCQNLTIAPELPATILDDWSYYEMFYGCSSLTTAPALPATTLTDHCYTRMFYGCSSLTTAPALPATTLTDNCYEAMFLSCSSLTTAPALPATTLAIYCYRQMFQGTQITTAPALPATTLEVHCYSGMFAWTNITTAPELPATTLQEYCYADMFHGCGNLNYVKCLATDISAFNCTFDWLENAAASGTFVKDANTTWPSNTSGIPAGWTIINE